jgi:penicillin-insensitive murein endopeptidase
MGTPLTALAGLWLLISPTLVETLSTASTAHQVAIASPESDVVDPAALLEMSDAELLERIKTDPAVLGPLSIGEPSSGRLFNPVPMPDDPRCDIADNAETWATAESIAAIQAGLDTVHELYPDTHPLRLGDFSDADGGRLKRHLSHQSGRDADVGFYFKSGPPGGLMNGTATNLDLPRNWALLRAWLVRTDVDVVLLDTRIQRLLYNHALSIGEDKDWLDRVFQFSRGYRDALVQHVKNHRNHYHVRFYNPVAQELGRRAYPLLVEAEIVPEPVYTVRHVVRPGQTMGQIAVRYGTSTRAIMQANGLRSTTWRAGRAYRIPVKAAAVKTEAVVIPPRLLPPYTPPALEAVSWPTAPAPAGSGSGGER